MRNFRNLSVWSKGHFLTLKIYYLTKSFPKDEIFGLVSQSAVVRILYHQT